MKNKSQFSEMLRKLEIAEQTKSADYGCIIMQTAKAITFCVLRKLSATGGQTKIINSLRRDIMEGSGDGCDLVNSAAVSILDETEKAHNRYGECLPAGWTEEKYTVKHLDKRIIIRSDDSAAWIEKEIAPISEIFRAVRSEVEKQRGVQIASRKYCYIDDLKTDETGAEEALYRRLPKYHTAVDENDETHQEMFNSIETAAETLKSKLTDKQKAVLNLRLSGYGEKAIASKMGITKQAIQAHMKAIQKKYIDLIIDEEKKYTCEGDYVSTFDDAMKDAKNVYMNAEKKTKHIDKICTPKTLANDAFSIESNIYVSDTREREKPLTGCKKPIVRKDVSAFSTEKEIIHEKLCAKYGDKLSLYRIFK